MRIFISALRFVPGRTLGGEVYLHSLLKELAEIRTDHRIAIAASVEGAAWIQNITSAFEVFAQKIPTSAVMRAFHERASVERLARNWQADVVFFPAGVMPKINFPSVLMIQDLVNEFYCRRFPGFRPVYYRTVRYLTRKSIRRADVVLTTTRAISNELEALRIVNDRQRIFVVPLGARAKLLPAERPTNLPRGDKLLILQPGDHLPHKSHHVGIEAMATLRRRFPATFARAQLILTSGVYADAPLRRFAEREKLQDSVFFLGKVAESELEWLWQHSAAACFPTIYEGYGLGVVEAQLRQTPVIASDIPVLREVSGGAAAFFRAEDAGDLANTIHRLLNDERERQILRQKGFENARGKSWREYAEQILQILAATAAAKKSNQ